MFKVPEKETPKNIKFVKQDVFIFLNVNYFLETLFLRF
jgi:hypothetical protein